MTTIRAVVFDLYGTLLRSERLPFQRRIPRRLGIPARAWMELVRRDLLVADYPDRESFVDHLIASLVDRPAPELRGELLASLEEELAGVRLVPGVRSMLKFLRRRGLRLAVLSNLASPYAEPLDALDLRGLFDVVALSCERRRAKPERGLYLEVCRELEVEPGEAMMVGDSASNDVRAPRRAGLESLRITGELEAFQIGWLDFAGGPKPLLAPGRPLRLAGRRLVPRRLEPVPDAYQGRYNLVVRAETDGADGGEGYYLKRYLLPASAHVEEFTGRLLRAIDLPAPDAGVIERAGEPVHWSREVSGGRALEIEPTAELAFDIGRHGAAAYLFSNADMRPRNALLPGGPEGRELLMLDFEHCLFNLALDLEGVAEPQDPRALDGLGAEELRRRLRRRVITPRSIRRIQREFFGARAYEPRLLEPFCEGWIELTRTAQRRSSELEQLLRDRAYREPYLIIGTRAYRRAFAGIDIDDILGRLALAPEAVLADWMQPEAGARAP